MFLEILRFELRQQFKSPLFWLIAAAFAALAFAAAGSDHIQIGGGIGNTHRNAPYVIIEMLTSFTLLGMFLIPVFVGGAALRDFEAGCAELFFATPLPRSAYLGGRFIAGYIAALAVMLAVAGGLLLGSQMPWLDPARLGPTSFVAYAYAFGVFIVPGLFFLSAMLFLLATLTRSMLGTYIGVIAFFVLWQVAVFGTGNIDHQTLGALIDPLGLSTLKLVSRYWSAQERNSLLPGLAGILLVNRLVWVGIGAGLLATAFALFRPDREGLRWARKRTSKAEPAVTTPTPRLSLPKVTLRHDAAARWTQFRQLAWFDTRGVLGGVAFIVMLGFGLMNLGGNLAFSNEMFGTKTYPLTHLMTDAMDGGYNFLLTIILAFYAGELVWRERAGKISEVTDAFPLPDWIPLLSKLVALSSVIVLFLLAGALECIGYQLLRGYTHVEPLLYLSNVALNAIGFILVGALALFLQVLANNKFRGYLLVVVFFVSQIALAQLHFDHHLYNFGSTPATPYSDMNGYGHFLAAKLWFDAYWSSLAVALLAVAALFWSRGTAQGWSERMQMARQRLRLPARLTLGAAVLAFVALGGWIYYNTNVLNRYVPGDVEKLNQANYEKQYRQYLDLAQPRITEVRADLDMYPAERRVEVRGHYTLVNKHDAPISDLHMRLPLEMRLVSVDFAAHEVVSTDATQGYTIYRLKQPLAPGASMPFDFVLQYHSVGFRNAPNDTRVVENGTFLDNQSLPHFGYSDIGQLIDLNDRRRYGLGPVPRFAKIDDEAARMNHLMCCDADWVGFESTVSTSTDQIALAPGYLEKDWTEGDRHYFHYKMDKPILDFFSFQSARYAVKRDSWNGIAVEVYYDPQHVWNVDRMAYAAKKSLEHFSQAYSPFQYRQLRVLEFPSYSRFAQSFANTVPFSESIGFTADLRDPADIDYVYYVTAHETAHQWWGHQVIGANVQGVTMLDETFAQYSALMVMEHEYGAARMRQFLKYELDRYLSGRAGETVEEMPLGLVENQDYIHYRKGSVAMYALKDYLGEATVDKALSRYVRDKAFQAPPYTTTREFLDYLRQDAGPAAAPLIDDLFSRITLYDNRVLAASAKKRDDGKYELTMTVHAGKAYADGLGKETPATLDQPLDLGVFARAPDGVEANQKILLLEKRRIADGDSSITLVLDEAPYEVGIDPYNKLVDRIADDNRLRVTLE